MENGTNPKPQIDLGPTSALLNSGSPKGMYTYFLLALCRNYFEAATLSEQEFSNNRIERCTASLIAFCPNKEVREQLWNKFLEIRSQPKMTVFSASTYTVGCLIEYLSVTLELESKATGGLL